MVMSTWRVYEKQWIIVFASRDSGTDPQRQCSDEWEDRWKGKVLAEDAMTVPPSLRSDHFPWYLKLRLWNLVAEYRQRPTRIGLSGDRAPYDAEALPQGMALVQAGSDEERELLDYGRKKLAPS